METQQPLKTLSITELRAIINRTMEEVAKIGTQLNDTHEFTFSQKEELMIENKKAVRKLSYHMHLLKMEMNKEKMAPPLW